MQICLAVATEHGRHRGGRRRARRRARRRHRRRQPGGHDAGRAQRGDPGDLRRRRRPRRRPRRAVPRLHPPRRRDAAPHRGGERRRRAAGHRHDTVRGGRRRRDDVAVRHRGRDVPLRRRRGPDRHRLPRRLRPGGDRAGRPVRRAPRAQPGLRAEHPPSSSRRRGVVRPRAVGLLPAPRHADRPGQAVLRVRAVEAISRPPAPAVVALAPGRTPGGDRGGRPLVPSSVWLGARRWSFPGAYGAAVAVAAAITGKSAGRRARLLAIFPTMHLSWGAGFLLGEPRRVS